MKHRVLILSLLIGAFTFSLTSQAASKAGKHKKGEIVVLSAGNYKTETSAKGVVFVDYWAPWCGFCKKLSPILDELAKKYKDNTKVKFTKLNVDNYKDLALDHQVEGLPTVIVYKDGKELTRLVGLQTKDKFEDIITVYGY